jgi:hypothetical protein
MTPDDVPVRPGAEPAPPRPPADRRALLGLGLLFLLILAVRLVGVYPPTLRHDPATIALQACRILEGERPLFWSGQAWMGAAGTYVEALLFALLGKNTLVMSLYAWALSALWILFNLVLALRLFGPLAAALSAVVWLFPTPTLLYWSSQARNDFQVFFIATPVLLLFTHDIVLRFRRGAPIDARVFLFGLFGGFSFWQNMAIGPCLVVTFAVLAVHLGRVFWRRAAWVYAPGWLLGFSPVIAYNLLVDPVTVRQGSVKGGGTIAAAAYHLVTNAFPIFWGMPLKDRPWTVGKAASLLFLAYVTVLLLAYAVQVFRRWRRGDDLLADQLVLGLLGFHLLVPTVTEYGRSFATKGNPILYITNLFTVAFLIPAVVIARLPARRRLLAALPFLIFFRNNVRELLPVAERFATTWHEKGLAAVQRFPVPDDRLIKGLRERRLTHGYSDWQVPWPSLAGLGLVEFARPYADRVLDYVLRVDAAPKVFWVREPDLPDGMAMIGARFERFGGVLYDFRREPVRDSLVEGYEVRASDDAPHAAALADRKIDSCWRAPVPNPGSWVEFRFPAEERVGRIVLLPEDAGALPQHLVVQASADGQAWETVGEWRQANVYFWSVRHPFLKLVKPRCELVLPRVAPARFLRIAFPAQKGRGSLRESFLYRTEPVDRPESAVDEEVAALAGALAPLRGTHLVVGDHYFMSYFKLKGFDVEFLTNRAVNNAGKRNPFLAGPRAVDFSRPLALIVPKSHADAVAGRLARAGVAAERRPFADHDLFLTKPAAAAVHLAWCGFDLLEIDPARQGTAPRAADVPAAGL